MLVNSVVLFSSVVVLRRVENTLRQDVNATLWLHLPLATYVTLSDLPTPDLAHGRQGDHVTSVALYVCPSVCLSVRALEGKRLELSSSTLVHI